MNDTITEDTPGHFTDDAGHIDVQFETLPDPHPAAIPGVSHADYLGVLLTQLRKGPSTPATDAIITALQAQVDALKALPAVPAATPTPTPPVV